MNLSESLANMSIQNDNTEQIQKKREDYIGWTDYFMAVAFLAAKRSKDPHFQVGACIVNQDMRIVGVGYNGMPRGCSDDIYPWEKGKKKLYVCHAEMNAILNKNSSDVWGCTIYVKLFPCNECAKIIIQSGIKEVVYVSDKKAKKVEYKASRQMLKDAGVICTQPRELPRAILLDPDDYFMGIAFLAAKCSKDPAFQVGACIVRDRKKVIGVGCNTWPNGCDYPWNKSVKKYFVCHAEQNAIFNAGNVKNCTIYVKLHPCNVCAQLIVQSGIKKVIYASDCKARKTEYKTAKNILQQAGVDSIKFKPKDPMVYINFNEDNDKENKAE